MDHLQEPRIDKKTRMHLCQSGLYLSHSCNRCTYIYLSVFQSGMTSCSNATFVLFTCDPDEAGHHDNHTQRMQE